MTPLVPNKPPTVSSPRRIMIVGEAPGKDESIAMEPFVGYSGQKLNKLLELAGHTRAACFIANVSQRRPSATSDHISLLAYDGAEIQQGILQLRKDVESYNPNIILLLGNLALKVAKDWRTAHKLDPNKYANKVSNWRGSIFICDDIGSPFLGRKCIASFHPAYCLRDFEKMPLLMFDIKKAVKHSTTPIYEPPKRNLDSEPTYESVVRNLHALVNLRSRCALDIEGGIDSMSCISFTLEQDSAFIVPFSRRNGAAYWTSDQELHLWRLIAAVLENPLIPKVLQNSLYDRFVLAYSYGIRVQGVVEDTMLKHWELYSELPKSLAVQTSLYTDEPFYKQERKSNDDKTFYEYCCKDSAITLEICNVLDRYLSGSSLAHYKLNVELLNPLLYMELRGIKYDVSGAAARRNLLRAKLYSAQAILNGLTGSCLERPEQITALVYANLLYKKAQLSLPPSQWHTQAYSHATEDCIRLVDLIHQANPTLATLGELETLLSLGLNVGSNKQMCEFFYQVLKLPVQTSDKKEQDDEGNPIEPGETVNYEALLNLSRLATTDLQKQVIQLCIEIRSLATRQRMLGISADVDGRIRCGYNIVGSNTGRITCYESPTGSGYNLQTIPNYTSELEAPGQVLGDRDLFIADSNHWFFQCDLKGADGWTVAAYSAMLGDRTMLDDYLFGLKPANIICLMLRGSPVDFRDRAALKAASKTVEKDAWDYFACKRVQHGASYLEGALTISRNILKDSEGKAVMSTAECKKLSDLFFQRYWGVRKYHDYIGRQLKANRGTPYLLAASGQRRYFFGRKDEILTKAVAFEPQANTTYATNLAMYKLWNDPQNRILSMVRNVLEQQRDVSELDTTNGCALRIEPLHQVHDALAGQFAKSDTEWAINKIKSYFNNKIKIAGIELVIPFDGGFGTSWGDLKQGVI